jgi:hypothetical protein
MSTYDTSVKEYVSLVLTDDLYFFTLLSLQHKGMFSIKFSRPFSSSPLDIRHKTSGKIIKINTYVSNEIIVD